ncbi:MAG TPA: DUF2167 domain-containing protein [Verrucomicrobiae bacterium]|nr:DUF2167 domain-containing protein [Verrucomicrobiae bacterium]
MSLSLASPNQAQIQWTSGPADASLGALADIKIPKGYHFTDATGASMLLTRMNNPVPTGLVGILAPESGQWWAVLEYRDIGYVKDADKAGIDTKATLKTISDRAQRQNEDRRIHNLPLITSVDWALAPAFSADTHTLEWAVLAKTQSGQVVNHTMRLLGRQGLLDATVVEPYQAQAALDLISLKELMKNISFKSGQRYTDYQAGDKISQIGLADLIGGDDEASATQTDGFAASAKSAGVWGWYVFAGVLAGGSVMLVWGVAQRRRQEHPVLATSLAGNGIGNGNGHASLHADTLAPVSAITGNGLETVVVKPAVRPKVTVARSGSSDRPGAHRQGARRRKIFDYHRFYTDTVMKLSSSGYTAEVPPRNGHTNGHTNGHSLAHAIDAQSPSNGAANQALMQAHLDLIANQKELIEEQKRLMIQQAKLIEEKSKLIAEKSQLLDRQTELFERDLL